MNDLALEAGVAFLAEAGLNLFAVLDRATLPAKTKEAMLSTDIPLADYRRLVLIGHGGWRMWSALQTWGMKTADPVDHFSEVMTRQFIREYLHDPPVFWLYPNPPYLVPLQQLGQLAGWSHPSPLGQGIHSVYGVWFAYRTAFLTTLPLPVRIDAPQPSPCNSCTDKPCIKTCPVSAVQLNHFNVGACTQHRLDHQSACADRCLARLACPFFLEHCYTLPQIQYHYRHSLNSMRTWLAGNRTEQK